jgi:hypothetical protein
MPQLNFLPSYIEISKTATDDLKFQLCTADMWFREINIVATVKDAYYGDLNGQSSELTVGAVLTFQDMNLLDLFFKNKTAGQNTTIVASGVLMERKRRISMGVIE